jgi:hypothetical protein
MVLSRDSLAPKAPERRFDRAGLVPELEAHGLVELSDAADPVQEIHVPRAAPELAVGHAQ